MMNIKPPRLVEGNRVIIIAPASPIDPAQIVGGMEILRDFQLEPVLGKNLLNLRSKSLFSASHSERKAEIIDAMLDDSIHAILIGTGGFGCAQLLPFIPYDLFRTNPKILMGFSDVTALNNALLAKSGVITFNGPTASVRPDFPDPDTEALRDAIKLLMSDESWEDKPFKRLPGFARCVYPGKIEGIAIGGNLTTFECLIGTDYMPDLNGTILFLEDVGIGGYELIRSLTHMNLAGIFDKVSGVVFGEFSGAPSQDYTIAPSIEDVIVSEFSRWPPCIYGMNFSHGETGAVIPIGAMTTMDAEKGTVSFEYPLRS